MSASVDALIKGHDETDTEDWFQGGERGQWSSPDHVIDQVSVGGLVFLVGTVDRGNQRRGEIEGRGASGLWK